MEITRDQKIIQEFVKNNENEDIQKTNVKRDQINSLTNLMQTTLCFVPDTGIEIIKKEPKPIVIEKQDHERFFQAKWESQFLWLSYFF